MDFETWMRRVDGVIGGLCGLTHRDIADKRWRDAYEDGSSPQEACDDLGCGSIEDLMDDM